MPLIGPFASSPADPASNEVFPVAISAPGAFPQRASQILIPQNNGSEHSFHSKRTPEGNCQTFKVQGGDRWTGDLKSLEQKERSEVIYNRKFHIGDEIRIEFKFSYTGILPSSPNWQVVGQLHTTPPETVSTRTPIISQQINSDGFSIIVKSQDKSGHIHSNTAYRDRNFVTGRFYHVAYKIKLSPSETGKIEAWIDGKKVISRQGPIGYTEELGSYFKFGVYRSALAGLSSATFCDVSLSGR